MRNYISLILLAALISNFSCKKTKEISYPSTMSHGENVLAINQITAGKDYSFGAKLGMRAELKIVITNLSGNPLSIVWFYSLGTADGWSITDYNNSDNTQTFTTKRKGENDLEMLFPYGPGSCKIDYYENSTSVIKTKYLSW